MTAATTDPTQRILDLLPDVRRSGAGWKARCPAHDDGTPSLEIKRMDTGKASVKCHAGCSGEDVMDALGLRLADLYPDGRDRPTDQWRVSGRPLAGARPRLTAVPTPRPTPTESRTDKPKRSGGTLGPVVATYEYRDESGAVLFVKTRHDPKTFRVWGPRGRSGPMGMPPDTRRVLYRLPELLAAVGRGETVYVVEGEKDVERLAALGVAAVCNFDGAGQVADRERKWRPEYGDALSGADVVIVRDLDNAGAAHALAVLDDLTGKAATVRIVEPVTGGEHDDVSDHLDAGHGLDDLVVVDPAVLRRMLTPEADEVPAPPSTGSTENLPGLSDEFWNTRPLLAHIRQAAWSRGQLPDVVFYALLARLSALRCHDIRVDTGISTPASLNTYVALAAYSGDGKSQSVKVAGALLDVPAGLDFEGQMPLGTGEGIAESYMGTVEQPGPGGSNQRPRMVRQQVRHNALFYVDEGQALVKLLERTGATVGATLRSAWGGETLGQRNASEERTRLIPEHSYSLGFIVGIQPEIAGPLLADAATGMPQRFLWASANDASLPEVPPPWPGALPWNPDVIEQGVTMVVAPEIRQELWRGHVARRRGEVRPAELDGQAPLALVKIAALLALLDERFTVSVEDWALAHVVWDTSCAVRDRLVEGIRAQTAREIAEKDARSVDLRVREASAVAGASAATRRVAAAVANRVHDAEGGGLTNGDAWRGLSGRDRKRGREFLDGAIEVAVAEKWIEVGDRGLTPGASRPS